MVIRLLAILAMSISVEALAWGARGHQAVTRCAIRLLQDLDGKDIYKAYLSQDQHLAFLSNAPDHYWRSNDVSKEVQKKNPPTHYISLEKMIRPLNKAKLETILKHSFNSKNQAQKLTDIGSAPHRILQFVDLLEKKFKELSKAKKKNKRMDEAILISGILSHFVGDLANPMHLTKDYDGWDKRQGGLHAYFESEVVSVLDLGLEAEVCRKARENLKKYKIADDYEKVLFSYIWESYGHLNSIFELDKKKAIKQPSQLKDNLKIPAIRREATAVKENFKPILVSRMAAGSLMLARSWIYAWRRAGSPKHKNYKSYTFVHKPEFIKPNY